MGHRSRYKKLSPFERVYFSGAKRFPPFAVQLMIEGDTLPPLDDLKRALVVAAEANVGARLVQDGKWWNDSGKAPAVRYVLPSENPSLDHMHFHERFSFTDKAPIEVLYWSGMGLVFRCAHALMDAGGLLFFAEETFRALREEPLLGTTMKSSEHDYLRQQRSPVRRSWPSANKISPVGPPLSEEAGFTWERRTITGQVSTGAARIAFSLAQLAQDRQADGTIRLMFPMDLRKRDGALRSTFNLSNPIFVELPVRSVQADFYGHILQSMADREELAISSLDSVFPWIPYSVIGSAQYRWHERQVRSDSYLLSGLISYIGSISLAVLSTKVFKARSAFFLPFDSPGSAITIIAVQHDNAIEIAASTPRATGADGRLGVVLERIQSELWLGKHFSFGSPPVRAHYEPAKGVDIILPESLSVYALIEQQLKAFAGRTAVIDGGRKYSFADLEHMSLVCALQLQKLGVRASQRVAVLGGRSIKTIISLLGILRLGATFVPLDPEWPSERIRFVLDDCGPSCLMLEKICTHLTDFLPRMLLDDLVDAQVEDSFIDSDLVHNSSPVYVLYTSGSTGRPKGVVVGQRSLLNYLIWSKGAYLKDLDVPIVFPFFTSIAFDLTLTSILIPLVTGGEIRIFPQSDPLSTIRSIVSDPSVNAVKLTPSHLWIFSAVGIRGGGLRKFIVGGEALPSKLAREISLQVNHCVDIFNEYGPTEATIGCVVHRYDFDLDLDAFVPIGRPIANTEVLLLDEHLQLVRKEEVGEVYLSGECLADGYLNRPNEDLRFSPHPFRTGTRMYRTGDRAMCSLGNEFHYRGRTDEQVKILGHRIEIAEIETAIEMSGYCDAFAVITESISDTTRLVAFVIWRKGAGEGDLRTALIRTLPKYMIPSRIVALSHLPLNVNGKVDKEKLPRQGKSLAEGSAIRSDEIEETLSCMVADLPKSPCSFVPSDQSLLELGIDSLQMMLLLARAAERFLPPSTHNLMFRELDGFYKNPTIQNLGRHLRRLQAL